MQLKTPLGSDAPVQTTCFQIPRRSLLLRLLWRQFPLLLPALYRQARRPNIRLPLTPHDTQPCRLHLKLPLSLPPRPRSPLSLSGNLSFLSSIRLGRPKMSYLTPLRSDSCQNVLRPAYSP